MTKRNSTPVTPPSKPANEKPEKPGADFPLFAHATGYWAKKVRGKLIYFGKWDDPDGAEKEWEKQRDALLSGKAATEDALTIRKLTVKFLTTKKAMRDAGELSPHTWNDYALVCNLILKTFGKDRLAADLRPADFERLKVKMSKKWGPVRVGNTINKIRIVFNYAWKNGLLDKPMIYGEGFRRPSKKTLRKYRQAQGQRMFEALEIRGLLGLPPWRPADSLPLRAMILLGINCGFGNADVGTLPLDALNLDGGWINFPRPKTAIERRCPLWPETVAALREWLAVRPTAKLAEHRQLVFLTAKGGSWAKDTSDNPVSKETRKRLDSLGINGHRSFYALRHGFQTIGDESGDFIAVRAIMGHADSDIAASYRERISDERLRKVAEHVRSWLFGAGK